MFPCACVNGFGYDDENDDCVLVRLIQTLKGAFEPQVSIYRSGANACMLLQEIEIPYYLDLMDKSGVFMCGHTLVHWIMRREWAPNSAKVLVAVIFMLTICGGGPA